jgi:ABC-2 type transport system permease protein
VTGNRRNAWAIAGGLVVGVHLLTNLLEGGASLKGWAVLSPVHYYALNKPLVPGTAFDAGAWAVLVLLTGIVLGGAAWLFARRDLGAAFALLPARPAGGSGGSTVLLGSVWACGLRDAVVPTLAWGLARGVSAMFGVSSAGAIMGPLRQLGSNIPWLGRLYGDLTSNEAYIGLGFFNYLPALLAIYAITQIWSWANDEEEGRLELLITLPVPRWQVLAARYSAALLSLGGILVLLALCLLGSAAVAGMPLNSARVWAGVGAVVPLVAGVLAFGLALATWLPRPGTAVGITAALVVIMFFLDVLAPIFDLPDAVPNLSLFHLYGHPLTQEIGWAGLIAVAVGAVALAAASLLGFGRRDIAH